MSVFFKEIRQIFSSKKEYYWLFLFLLFIPIINGIANVTTNFFPKTAINPGTIRVFLILMFVILAYSKCYVSNFANNFIFGFAIYWLLLIPFAENLSFNLLQAPKVLLSLMLFPIGYYLINTLKRLEILMLSIILAWSLFILNFYVANIFKIGQYGYGGEDSSLFFGSGGINLSKAIALIYLITPLFFKICNNKQWRRFVVLLIILAFPVLMLSLKRSALLALGIGFIIYLFFTPFKRLIVKGFVIFSIILISLTPLYWDKLIGIIEIREKSLNFEDPNFAERESRVGEIELVFKLFREGSLKHKLLGTNLLHNVDLYDGERMLHTDFMVLLYGTGLIGLVWYFSIYWVIYKKFALYKSSSFLYLDGKATLLALISASLIQSIAGIIGDINLRSLFFLFIGSLVGTVRTEYFNHKNIC